MKVEPRPSVCAGKMTASPAAQAVRDLNLARASGTNVLLIGQDPQVSDAAEYVAGSVAAPLTIRFADGLRLPLPPARDAVVIAHDVDELFPDEQLQLLQWLRVTSAGTRIVSTASPALWPMVQHGAFNSELYYHLNIVCIQVS